MIIRGYRVIVIDNKKRKSYYDDFDDKQAVISELTINRIQGV